MSTPVRALPPVLTLVCLSLLSAGAPVSARQATNDLDQFMAVVLKRRDDNWRKLQQYILEERETADFFAPGKYGCSEWTASTRGSSATACSSAAP